MIAESCALSCRARAALNSSSTCVHAWRVTSLVLFAEWDRCVVCRIDMLRLTALRMQQLAGYKLYFVCVMIDG